MQYFLRALSVLCLAMLASRPALAENPPTQDPALRIEAGMHTGVISRGGISADGRLLVTASDDKTVRLWSLPDGKPVRTLRVPISGERGGAFYCASIDPDGRVIAAGGWDGYSNENGEGHFAYLMDSVTGRMIRRLGPLPRTIHSLAFSKDGSRLAAGLYGEAGLRVWTFPFDGEPFVDVDYKGGIYGLSFDDQGRLVTTSEDKFMRLYDADLKLLQKHPTPNGEEPFSVHFAPSGDKVVVGIYGLPSVQILKLPFFTLEAKLDVTGVSYGNLTSATWSNDGSRIYAGGQFSTDDGINQIVEWSGENFRDRRFIGGPNNTVQDLAVTPEGNIVYTSSDPSFGIIAADGNKITAREPVTADMRGKRSGTFLMAPDASKIYFGLKERDEDPWLMDLPTLAFASASEKPAGLVEPIVDTLAIEDWINNDAPKLDGKLLPLWNNETSRSLAIHPNNRSFFLGTDWAIWRFGKDGKEIGRKSVEGTAWGVNVSADGNILVAALDDGTIRWYNSDLEELLAFFVHTPDKRWIAWTPSGYYAASPGGEDLLGWHVNGKRWDDTPDFFPAMQFRNRFYRPDIVQMVLKTRDEKRAIEQANFIAKREAEEASVRAMLPPVIEIVEPVSGIETDQQTITLRYTLRSPSGQRIKGIEVLIDGRPVTDRAFRPLEPDNAATIDFPIPPRDCEVALIAIGEENNSAPAVIRVLWKGKVTAEKKPRLFAVLIGVSDYDDASLKLSYADDDARDLDDFLKAQQGVTTVRSTRAG